MRPYRRPHRSYQTKHSINPIISQDLEREAIPVQGFDPPGLDEQPLAKESKRRLCSECHRHRPVLRFRGRAMRARHCDLCARCYRRILNQRRATWIRRTERAKKSQS